MTRHLYTINIKAVLEINVEDGQVTAKLSPETDVMLRQLTNEDSPASTAPPIESSLRLNVPESVAWLGIKSTADALPAKSKVKQTELADLIPDDLFTAFWAVYPRKEKKKEAHRIWVRDKLELIGQDIINDVQQRKNNHDRWADIAYIPLPSSYLNSESWNDNIIARSSLDHNKQPATVNKKADRESKRERQIREGFDEYFKERGNRG